MNIAPFKDSHRGRKASDYNKMFQLNGGIAIPWHLPGLGAGIDLVTGVIGLGDQTVTPEDVDVLGQYDASAAAGSRFTDDTTDANDAGTQDVLVLPATEEDELDFLLIGDADPFFGLNVTDATGGGAGGAGVFEYCTVGDGVGDPVWTAFSYVVDETTGFTGGSGQVTWEIPEDWAPVALSEVDDVERYYVRFRVTTVYSTNPALDRVGLYKLGAAVVPNAFEAPAAGLIDQLVVWAGTKGGGNNATVVELHNHSRKTRGRFVIDNDAAEYIRTAATYGLYVERGDHIGIQVLQEDGTTELQDVEVFPEIRI